MTKKIFTKNDFKDILLYLNEENEAIITNDFKGCKILVSCESSAVTFNSKTSLNVFIINEIEAKFQYTIKYSSSYDTFHKRIADCYSRYETSFLNGSAKTYEELMAEKVAEYEKAKLEEEEKNKSALVQYIQTGEENFFADCLEYYEDSKNLYHTLDSIISDELNNEANSQFKIAFLLKVIYDKNLFKIDGYRNIYDYANDRFNIARGTTSNWLMLVSNFGVLNEQTGFYSIDERLKDFSITQLILMRQLKIEQIEQLGIVPSMSCKEIKQHVKDKLSINRIASSVSDTSSLPDNPENEAELYGEDIYEDSAVESDEDITDDSSDDEAKKKLLSLVFKGGTVLSDKQIEFLNLFLATQPIGKDIKLYFA